MLRCFSSDNSLNTLDKGTPRIRLMRIYRWPVLDSKAVTTRGTGIWQFFDTNSNVCASESETCRPNLSTRLKGNSKTLGAGECVHRFGILRRRKSLARWNKVSLIGREGSLSEGGDRLDRERFAGCIWVRDCLNSELITYREKRCLLGVGQSGEIELCQTGKGGFQPSRSQNVHGPHFRRIRLQIVGLGCRFCRILKKILGKRMTGLCVTDPFGQVRSRSRQLAVMVSVTVIGYMTGSCGHGHATTERSSRTTLLAKDLMLSAPRSI
jgi:hypothetical protein